MKRPARLKAAKAWLPQFDGSNVLQGYCEHFGIDWRCAAIELQRLGVAIDEDELQRRAEVERQVAEARQRRREARAAAQSYEAFPFHDFDPDYVDVYEIAQPFCEADGPEENAGSQEEKLRQWKERLQLWQEALMRREDALACRQENLNWREAELKYREVELRRQKGEKDPEEDDDWSLDEIPF